jgi:uncharacterized protein (AIM24 family)
MRDDLLGVTQPMLSISLDPGESVVGEASRFAWMTDSIEMAAADETGVCVYTAIGEPGVVAFASQRPSRILSVDVSPQDEGYRFRRSGFVARTPGVQMRADPAEHGLALWRIGGSGRAWVELAGDVVRRELTAGRSLRAHPKHVGMFDGMVAIMVTQLEGISSQNSGYPCAVLSGPGVIWLQSMPSAAEQLRTRAQPSSQPPSTLMLTPLTARLPSRNATASTTSAISASRPHGVRAST